MSSNILVHKHLIVRAEVKIPPTDPEMISKVWMPSLIDTIGMKALCGPEAVYSNVVGNRGLTAFAIIETSHIVLHVWDECDPCLLQLDVYTCGPLDPMLVVGALYQFEPVSTEMKYLDRENGLLEIPVFTDEEVSAILDK